MIKNEIKKALYRERPTAVKFDDFNYPEEQYYTYKADLKELGTIYFKVPYSDMGENKFAEELPAQLLIRWLHSPEIHYINIGHWYKSESGALIFVKRDVSSFYGFHSLGAWGDNVVDLDVLISRIQFWSPATNEDVREAFTKEIFKRGFQDGTIFLSEFSDNGRERIVADVTDILCSTKRDSVHVRGADWERDRTTSNPRIYSNGKWVQIVGQKDEIFRSFESRKPVYNLAMDIWGKESQMQMAQEEATELALAVRKHLRRNTPFSFAELAGEIADVEIMIEQMELMHEDQNLRELVETTKAQKVKRLQARLAEKSYEAIKGEL